MSNTPIDNLLRLVGEQYSDEVRAALAQAWDEGVMAASPHGGAYLRSFLLSNPYTPVRYP